MPFVVICASGRFESDVAEFAGTLEDLGVATWRPQSVGPQLTELPDEMQRLAKLGLGWRHLDQIEKADAVFIFNKNGYVGSSVTLEMGYALACRRRVFALEPDADLDRDVFIEGYAATPEELVNQL